MTRRFFTNFDYSRLSGWQVFFLWLAGLNLFVFALRVLAVLPDNNPLYSVFSLPGLIFLALNIGYISYLILKRN